MVYLDRSAEECAISITDQSIGRRSAAMTLPMALAQCGCDAPIDILKMDIEGAERQVLADCASWLGRANNHDRTARQLHREHADARP